MRYFFAYNFTNGSDNKARDILEAHSRQVRQKDLIIVTLFGGASFVMSAFAFYFTFIPSEDERKNLEMMGDVMPTYRFMIFCIYLVFAAGLCSQIYTKFEINYLYIFQIDPHFKMSPWQLYKVSIILYFIVVTGYTLNMMEIKMDYVFKNDNNQFVYVLALIIAMVVYCIQPFFRCGYRTARSELGKTIW